MDRSVIDKICLGGTILFNDTDIAPEPVKVRITGIKHYINSTSFKPVIELSNETPAPSILNTLRKIDTNEVVVDDRFNAGMAFAKRRFRDAEETSRMLQLAQFQTQTAMQFLAGDESLQFDFALDTSPQAQVVSLNLGWNSFAKQVQCAFEGETLAWLRHYTIAGKDRPIITTGTQREYKYWAIGNFTSAPLIDPDRSYYLYAKCSKLGGTGVFLLSENPIALEQAGGFWHFLVALVNTEYEGVRNVVSMYGFTEVLPGRITTDKIVSSNGNTYFDLQNNEIGGKINFIDGLISGEIGVGNAQGVNAGLSGTGSAGTDVRLWAGAAAANKNNAPFRVRHDGKMFATDAEIQGKVVATSGEFKGKVIATSGSFENIQFKNKIDISNLPQSTDGLLNGEIYKVSLFEIDDIIVGGGSVNNIPVVTSVIVRKNWYNYIAWKS